MATNAQITHMSTQRFAFENQFVTPRSKEREERRLARQVVAVYAPKKAELSQIARLQVEEMHHDDARPLAAGVAPRIEEQGRLARGLFQSPLMFSRRWAATEIQRMWRGSVNRSDDADMAEILGWLKSNCVTVR
jgi:hypothetical protein